MCAVSAVSSAKGPQGSPPPKKPGANLLHACCDTCCHDASVRLPGPPAIDVKKGCSCPLLPKLRHGGHPDHHRWRPEPR